MSNNEGLYDDALATFYAESRDMLTQIEDTLLALESDPSDRENINALFRAAHTIKGSAGLFGLDRVVAFTHQVESVLDKVRNGELMIDIDMSDVLLKSSDVIAALLSEAESKTSDPADLAQVDNLANVALEKLGRYLGKKVEMAVTQQADEGAAQRGGAAAAGVWHISMRFGENTFRNGFDPLSVIAYLSTLGELKTVIMVDQNLPGLDALDAESCYLGFEVRLLTEAPKADIDGAFEFLREDCILHIFPPNRRASDFIALLRELPDEAHLGELLVECGALSKSALEAALAQQGQQAENDRRGAKSLGEILVEQKKVHPEVLDAALQKQGRPKESKSEESRFVRVPADKLDDLINLVGELVICGASANLLAQRLRDPQMIETTQQMSGLVEEIRNGTLGLRMVQIGETFARFRRVVRDTAAELGKEIHLEIEGAETELDKSVVEKIGDPLMHLVRNAMDHGIEMPEVRKELGKAPYGTLKLSAHHDSGHIVIQVDDDGKGLDGEKILAKAKERGLVAPNQILSESDKLNLIFEPGFSTAEKVTNLSGRGVGMDVVKKNIEALRGSVVLRSEVGAGSTIEIRLPLTLAIIDGFLVKVGRNSYVIPLHSVIECINPEQSELAGLGNTWTGVLDLRGEVLPFLDMRRVFEVEEPAPARRSVVVVRNGEMMAGLVVDQLLGEYQTVIKPLGKLFRQLRGISGSTVLGSGEVALILDVVALTRLAVERAEQDEMQRAMAGVQV
ncbi:chemotaxis protein CheA [Massilia sp. W12]|uniref:chemotaxis protein CheA n=1 Tax=Massilia sp. W12 TaxID=3126507 RepID=UPI0030CBBEEA